MKPEEIKFGDWGRMFMGETPPEFLIEVIIRMAFIYLLLLVAMRLLGNRMSAQLSRNELLAVVTLAAAIGVPLQAPDRGLLPALIIAIIVVLIGRLAASLAAKNQKLEQATQGNLNVLVQDSKMLLKDMLHSRITPDRVFSQLRHEGVRHLGEVKRLCIEANGSFALIREDNPRPGLSVLPPWDEELLAEQKTTDIKACTKCGQRKEQAQDNKCPNFGNEAWTDAIY